MSKNKETKPISEGEAESFLEAIMWSIPWVATASLRSSTMAGQSTGTVVAPGPGTCGVRRTAPGLLVAM